MAKKNLLRRTSVFGLVALIAFLGAAGACAWSPKAADYPVTPELLAIDLPHRLRSGPEHDAALRRVGNPYILDVEDSSGALCYYGARHATDRSDPQIKDIEDRWAKFRPTAALCEGRSRGYFLGWPFEQLGGLSEPALVHKLARRSGIPIYSLEPRYEDEVAALLKSWSPEQVGLYFTMRVYWSEAGGTPDEGLAENLLRKRTDVEGLRGSLKSAADIDRVWKRDFVNQPDWRGLQGEPDGTYLAEISEASRTVRGEHMARVLIGLVRKGGRVFAVVGSGHVIRQEWALRAALGAQPAEDQPVATAVAE